MADYGRCVTHHACACIQARLALLEAEHDAAQKYRSAGMQDFGACFQWQDAVSAAEKVKEGNDG